MFRAEFNGIRECVYVYGRDKYVYGRDNILLAIGDLRLEVTAHDTYANLLILF